MTSHKKRRLYPIVDRSLQYRFLAMILSYCMIIVFVLAFFLLVPDIFKLVNQGLSLDIRAAAAEKMLTLHSRVWPAIITVVCILGLHSFRAFHRLIGPLYRFRWAFDQVKSGELNFRIKLRKNDYLHREEETFNKMLHVLAEKWANMQLAGLDALRTLGDIENATAKLSQWTEEDRKVLDAHRRHLENLVDAAGYFRIQPTEKFPEEPVS